MPSSSSSSSSHQHQALLDDLFARLKGGNNTHNMSSSSSSSKAQKQQNKNTKMNNQKKSETHLTLIVSSDQSSESTAKQFSLDLLKSMHQRCASLCEEYERDVDVEEKERYEKRKNEVLEQGAEGEGEHLLSSPERKKKERQQRLNDAMMKRGGAGDDADDQQETYLSEKARALKMYRLHQQSTSSLSSSSSSKKNTMMTIIEEAQQQHRDNINESTTTIQMNGFFEYFSLSSLVPPPRHHDNDKVDDKEEKEEEEHEDEESEETHHFPPDLTYATLTIDLFITVTPALVENIITKQHELFQIRKANSPEKDFSFFTSLFIVCCCCGAENNDDDKSVEFLPTTTSERILNFFDLHRAPVRYALSEIRSKTNSSRNSSYPDEQKKLYREERIRNRFLPVVEKNAKVYDEASKDIRLQDEEKVFFGNVHSDDLHCNENFSSFIVGVSSPSSSSSFFLHEQLLRRLAMESGSSFLRLSSSSSSETSSLITTSSIISEYILFLLFGGKESSVKEIFTITIGTSFFPHFCDGIGLLEATAARSSDLRNGFIKSDAMAEFDEKNNSIMIRARRRQEKRKSSGDDDNNTNILDHDQMMKQVSEKLKQLEGEQQKQKQRVHQEGPGRQGTTENANTVKEEDSLWDF